MVEIRPYTTADEASCRACIVQRQDAERLIDSRIRPGEEIADEYVQQMQARCHDYAGVILLAEAAGEVVGLALVLARVPFEGIDEPRGEYAIVVDLVVRDGYRRRGIGTLLLRAAERYARQANATELRINVLRGNHGARELYRQAGFRSYAETLSMPLAAESSIGTRNHPALA